VRVFTDGGIVIEASLYIRQTQWLGNDEKSFLLLYLQRIRLAEYDQGDWWQGFSRSMRRHLESGCQGQKNP
jgi:hypothetical protein